MQGALSTPIKWTFTETLWNCFLHMARQFVQVLMKAGTVFAGTLLCPGVGTSLLCWRSRESVGAAGTARAGGMPVMTDRVMWTRFWPSKFSLKYSGAFPAPRRALWHGMASVLKGLPWLLYTHCTTRGQEQSCCHGAWPEMMEARVTAEGWCPRDRKQHPWDWLARWRWIRHRRVRSDSQDFGLSSGGNVLQFIQKTTGEEAVLETKREFGFGLDAYSHHVDIWSEIKYWTIKSCWVVIRQEFVGISLWSIYLLAHQYPGQRLINADRLQPNL